VVISQPSLVAPYSFFQLLYGVAKGAVRVATMATGLERNAGGKMDEAVDSEANTAAILANCDDSICRAIEVLADAALKFSFDASSERFADIHLPAGDLYTHEDLL
jgi:hypothetical protein